MAVKPLPATPAYELDTRQPKLSAAAVVKGNGQNTYRMPAGMMNGGQGNQNDAGPCGDVCPGC